MTTRSIKKVFFGLPAYNEKDSIQPLFEKIASLKETAPFELEILFYDDGCTDGTKEAVTPWLSKLPITYLDGQVNKGLGTGMNTLLSHFVKHGTNDDALVIMDCDDTHDPAQIPEMVRVLESSMKTDVVIASRYRQGALVKGVPIHRVWMSIFAALLYKAIHPIRNARDYTCGYRLYSHACLSKAMSQYSEPLIKERGFACMVELLLKVKSVGTGVAEIPLRLRYDNKRSASKMDVSGNAFRLLKKLVAWRTGGLT